MDAARKKHAKHMYSLAFTQHKEFVQHHRNTLILQEEMEASPAHSHEVLVSKVIDAAMRLEALSRKMLTDALPMASLGRRILVADRDIQLRDANAAGGGDIVTADDCWQEDEGQPIWEHESLQIGLYLPQDNPSALKASENTATSLRIYLPQLQGFKSWRAKNNTDLNGGWITKGTNRGMENLMGLTTLAQTECSA